MQKKQVSGASRTPVRTAGTGTSAAAGTRTRPASAASGAARTKSAAAGQKSVPRKKSPAPQPRRSVNRRRKKRRTGRLTVAIVALVLVLGLIGVGLMISTDEVKKETLQVYPMEYTDVIRRNAAMFNLEPAYVAAVILAESSYNPQAVSGVNAQGLMQLMPDTADWIAGKFDETYEEGSLFNPEINIRYGCWYLGFLMDRYDGDKRCASAAYHSGQGTVDKWLKDPAYSTDGKTLDVIAGSNADTYVNRVLEYYEKYEELYRNQVAA